MNVSTPARVPTRRNTELVLLLVATLVIFLLQVSVELALIGEVTQIAFVLTVICAVTMGVAHVGIRVFAPYADPVLLPCAGLITGIGVVFIRRLDMSAFVWENGARVPDYETEADRAAMALFDGAGGRQLMYMIAAVVVFGVLLALIRDHRNLSRYPFIIGLVGVLTAASPVVFGSTINGSRLWINFGFVSIQPSEFAKLLLLIFFAYYLVRKREVLSLASRKFLGIHFPRAKDLVPVLVVWGVSVVILIGIRDLGTSLLFFGMFVAMLYIATERISWIIIGLSLFMGGVVMIYPFFDHLQLRVAIWLDPFSDPLNDGRQLVQSLIGLGSGGLFGAGPGAGQPQETTPAANSDFILSGLGEELGLVGLAGILMLYLLIVARGMRAGIGVRDSFGKLLAGGLAFCIGFQLFVVLGGVSGMIPLTGQTAPFLAAGGSSLLANWVLLALLVRISDAARRPKAAPAGPIKIAPPPPAADDSPTQIVNIEPVMRGDEVPPSNEETALIHTESPPADAGTSPDAEPDGESPARTPEVKP